jgi:N-carbamoyl-L-amino-acid hydrolase
MLRVNRTRLAARLHEMAQIGATARGGVHRLALTDVDRQGRDLLAEWCEYGGHELVVDNVGSMFATRKGTMPQIPPFLIGSHLDSQPMAGAFDGSVGVLCALEVLDSLNDLDIETRQSIQCVNWTNEEGARFRPPLVASSIFAGLLDAQSALDCRDPEGIRYGDELKRIGYAGTHASGWPISGYIEVHIEQGTVLEEADAVIGVVTAGVGIRDLTVTVVGDNAHAACAMHCRRDALVGAAEMIIATSTLGLEAGPDAGGTVGRITVPSDSHSVVPGLAKFTLDMRHPNREELDALEAAARRRFQEIAAARHLEVSFESIFEYLPIPFDTLLRQQIQGAADGLGHATRNLASRAGHDAWNMARIAPAAMIFIPCRDGISHNEAEFAEFEHIAAAADVLLNTIATVAGTSQRQADIHHSGNAP